MEIKITKISGSPREVEEAFGIKQKTLANLRSEGKGPKYHKPGRIIYFFKDVEDWIRQFPVHTKDSIGLEK